MLEAYQDLMPDFFSNWFSDFVGCFGTAIILITYALLQAGQLESRSFLYSLLNVIGALLILTSLFFSWNLAAVLMESAWIAISVYGMFNALCPSKPLCKKVTEESL